MLLVSLFLVCGFWFFFGDCTWSMGFLGSLEKFISVFRFLFGVDREGF